MNFSPFRRRSGLTSVSAGRPSHLSIAKSRVGRSLSRTGVILKNELWIFPLIAMLVLMTIGYFLRQATQHTMQENIRTQLQTLLDVEVSTLTNWLEDQESTAQSMANDIRVRDLVYELMNGDHPEKPDSDAKPKSSPRERLIKELAPRLAAHDFHSFLVIGLNGKILAADEATIIGDAEYTGLLEPYIRRVEEGETVVVPPYPSRILMKDPQGRLRSGVPVMLVMAPLRDAGFLPIGALALRISPDRGFTEILQQARMGASGETYAFDKSGTLISNSRFDDKLMQLGLIVDEPGSQSILHIQLRDPGGNLLDGYRPKERRSDLPLIKPVAEALAGRNGVDAVGYRGYRGVPVVGAWKFLPKYGIGIITMMDRDEAYRPLRLIPYAFFTLLAMLALSSMAIFAFSIFNARLQREAQQAALESKKLGQYHLEEKLGSGGMGVVYRGRHSLLRRPTEIKMLQPERVTQASIERFEREVQITCQLNHPNTVQIYDFGRTPEGLFFYAMEFLDGVDLQKLVEKFGPQPEGRVIRILTQVCGSLYEAHSLGLVHRDIKPANVMLNRRGGEPDMAKVLDFGLVKALNDDRDAEAASGDSLTGTPLYMSPEAIQTPHGVDGRSDLYSLGAVAYFLLTGKPVFDAGSIAELCRMHVSEPPIPPSERLGRPVSAELEEAILSCLEKPRSKRPQTARDLAAMIARAPTANAWSVDEAEIWWSRYEREQGVTPERTPAAPTPTADQTGRTYISNE